MAMQPVVSLNDKRVFSKNKMFGDAFFLIDNLFAEFVFLNILAKKESKKSIFFNFTSHKIDFYGKTAQGGIYEYEFEIAGDTYISNWKCVEDARKVITELSKNRAQQKDIAKQMLRYENIGLMKEVVPFFASPARKFIRNGDITNFLEKINYSEIQEEGEKIYTYFFKGFKAIGTFKNFYNYKLFLNQNNRSIGNAIYEKFYGRSNASKKDTRIKEDNIMKMFINKNISEVIYNEMNSENNKSNKIKNIIGFYQMYKERRAGGVREYNVLKRDFIKQSGITEVEFKESIEWLINLFKTVKYKQMMVRGDIKTFKGVEIYKLDRNKLFTPNQETYLLEMREDTYTVGKYKSNTFISIPKELVDKYF